MDIKRLTPDQKGRWRVIKIDAARLAAGICCVGVDFKESSKNDIYKVVEDGQFVWAKADREKFERLMDALAKVEQELARERRSRINQVLNETE